MALGFSLCTLQACSGDEDLDDETTMNPANDYGKIKGNSLVATGGYREALEIITKDFRMPDIKEGEFSVSHLWIAIHKHMMEPGATDKEVLARYPLPYELDYRMHE